MSSPIKACRVVVDPAFLKEQIGTDQDIVIIDVERNLQDIEITFILLDENVTKDIEYRDIRREKL